MGTNVNHSVESKCSDLAFVDPLCIVIPEEFCDRDPPPDEVLEMAVSLHRNGQRRPVECRKDPSGKWILVHGFVRVIAARMILNGFVFHCDESNSDQSVRDRRFRLIVTVIES